MPWWWKLAWLGKPNFSSSSHKASKPRQKDSLRDLHIYMFSSPSQKDSLRDLHIYMFSSPSQKDSLRDLHIYMFSSPSQKDSQRDLHIYMLFLTLSERQPERSPHLRVVLDPHRKTAWEIPTLTCCSRPSQKDSLRYLHIYMLFLTLTERQPERSHLRVVLDPHRKTAWEISTFMCYSFVYPPQPPLHILHGALLYLKPIYTFLCVQKLPVHSITRSKYHQWQWPWL